MDYDTALVTGAALVDQTGVMDLANLASDSELVLNTFALNAHRAVYRRLQARGIDPTLLTSASSSQLKDAIAYEAVGRLALAGYLGNVDAAAMLDLALKSAERDWRPAYASTDSPASGADSIPAVGHYDTEIGGTYSDDFPSAI